MISFARFEFVNDPWLQSCMMMNVRTNSSAVSGSRRIVSHHAFEKPQNMRAKLAASGTSVLSICHVARPASLFRNAAARSWMDFDLAVSGWVSGFDIGRTLVESGAILKAGGAGPRADAAALGKTTTEPTIRVRRPSGVGLTRRGGRRVGQVDGLRGERQVRSCILD